MEKMVRDGKKEDIMTAECQAYQNEEGSFGRDSAKRQRKNKNIDPGAYLHLIFSPFSNQNLQCFLNSGFYS